MLRGVSGRARWAFASLAGCLQVQGLAGAVPRASQTTFDEKAAAPRPSPAPSDHPACFDRQPSAVAALRATRCPTALPRVNRRRSCSPRGVPREPPALAATATARRDAESCCRDVPGQSGWAFASVAVDLQVRGLADAIPRGSQTTFDEKASAPRAGAATSGRPAYFDRQPIAVAALRARRCSTALPGVNRRRSCSPRGVSREPSALPATATTARCVEPR